jgi:hypothetical protein
VGTDPCDVGGVLGSTTRSLNHDRRIGLSEDHGEKIGWDLPLSEQCVAVTT